MSDKSKSELYCLLDLGIKIDKTSKDSYEFVFKFKRDFYRAESLEKRSIAVQIVSGTKKLEEFLLHNRTDLESPDTEYLSLFLNPNATQRYSSPAKQRIVSYAFEIIEKMQEENSIPTVPPEEMEEDIVRNDAQILYNRLKRAHAMKNVEQHSEHFQHEKLRPVLRPYQLKAVKWMINRETKIDTVNIPFIELRSKRFPGTIFYMDVFTSKIYDYEPSMRQIPCGGILADEMGLGKTIEMLSLLLYRKRQEGFVSGEVVDENYYKNFIVPISETKKSPLRCICYTKSSKHPTIMCGSCKTRQHMKCVLHTAKLKTTFNNYTCPDCHHKSFNIIDSKSTLIVSPLSIKHQWYSEIKRHVRDDALTVFMYEGVKKGNWIAPEELAAYDVILTDYNVLTSEIYFTKLNERTSRHAAVCAKKASPLQMIRWYRTCLDEAQMVETPTNQCARMVNSLPAINRWAVTGTPIEKNISTLFGLIFFLNYEPYANSSVWNYYVAQYQSGNYEPLIEILQKVMWRTCKIDVLDEIGIPPQSEVVHYVQMSDLQRFFYRSEHAQFRQLFNERAAKVSSGGTTSRISAQTMKYLMEPLRKLRQDCTIPSIFYRSGVDQFSQKKLLTPSELHDHMIKNTEVELKTCLRTISSSLNGIASCHIMRDEYNLAHLSYQSVLNLAAEYHDKKIHVDTLLQIHAVHNMILISKYFSSDTKFNIEESEDTLAKLEWKYIETYKNKVKEVEERLKNVQNTLKELDAKQLSDKGNAWWRQVLYDERTDESALLEKISLDQKDFGMNFAPQSTRGVDLHLTTWIDKVNEGHRKILRNFKDLEYFHGNLKPKSTLTEDELFKIEYLVQSAYQCHLFLIENKDDSDSEEQPQPKRTCQLCRAKANLNEYECLIFNKYHYNEFELRGSWNPSEQEYVFKTLFAYSKRSNFDQDIINAGDTELKLIETFKNEFKEYSQYWVEINYTVSAYDELNMCKSRLEAVDMENDAINLDPRKSNMRVPRHMVTEILQDMQTEKTNAELNFVRIKGRLKYLEHLKEANEPEVCPICKQMPEERYAVLLCGHSLCMMCVAQMAKYQRNRLSCALCRHTQQYRDVFYATLNSNECEVLGSYSAKLVRIVKEVLRIRNEEPEVKIVIFSQWEGILTMLAQALQMNKITYILHTNNHRAVNQIEVFKTGPQTCLLLPLASGSKGLNLTEATHVFLVEPILNPSEELQAIGRIHRIGQTRPTFVHHFIMQNTIEETIYTTVTNDKSGVWTSKAITVDDLKKLFELEDDQPLFLSSQELMEIE